MSGAINVNRLLRDIYADALDPTVTVVTKRPADLGARLPLVYARHAAGSGMDPERASWASVTVDAYTGLEVDPFDLAKAAHDRLVDVQKQQTVFPDGWVSRLEVLLPPWENNDPLESTVVNRATAEYRLLLRSHP